MVWARCSAALFLVSPVAPTALSAQQVRLLIRDDQAGTPISGAIVRLIRFGEVVAQALTTESGRLVLTAREGGTYSIRIDRIGYEGTTITGIEVPSVGVASRELRLPSIRLELPTVEVYAESPCDPIVGGGRAVVALWDEIRKALDATIITRESGETPLHVRTFRRETDANGSPLRRWNTRSAVERGVPFTALPEALLETDGFVRIDSGRATLHGPDAELLLAPSFVGTHCYRLVAGDSGRLGLGFEPRPDLTLPDIGGVLWVDTASSELRNLIFGYRNPPTELQSPLLGGQLEFERLDDGGWIVRDWYIRSPRFGARGRRDPRGLLGYLDVGGQAEVAADEAGGSTWSVITGMVWDSLSARGLAGAMVTIPVTGDSVVTDSSGRFSLVVQHSGDHLVAIRHPRLGLLDEPTTRTVLLSIGDSVAVAFGVPSLATFVDRRCGAARRNPAIIGIVQDPSGRPVVGVDIQFWSGPLGSRTVARSVRVATNGAYALCDLPPGVALTVRSYRGSSPLAEEVVRLGIGEHRWVDLSMRNRALSPEAR